MHNYGFWQFFKCSLTKTMDEILQKQSTKEQKRVITAALLCYLKIICQSCCSLGRPVSCGDSVAAILFANTRGELWLQACWSQLRAKKTHSYRQDWHTYVQMSGAAGGWFIVSCEDGQRRKRSIPEVETKTCAVF